jgi:hypothetical protein
MRFLKRLSPGRHETVVASEEAGQEEQEGRHPKPEELAQ